MEGWSCYYGWCSQLSSRESSQLKRVLDQKGNVLKQMLCIGQCCTSIEGAEKPSMAGEGRMTSCTRCCSCCWCCREGNPGIVSDCLLRTSFKRRFSCTKIGIWTSLCFLGFCDWDSLNGCWRCCCRSSCCDNNRNNDNCTIIGGSHLDKHWLLWILSSARIIVSLLSLKEKMIICGFYT